MRVTLQGSGVVSLLQVSMDNFVQLEEVGHIGSKVANKMSTSLRPWLHLSWVLKFHASQRALSTRVFLKPPLQLRLDLTLTSVMFIDTKRRPTFLADSLILMLFSQETRSGEKQAAADFQALRSSVKFGIVDNQTGTIWNCLSCT